MVKWTPEMDQLLLLKILETHQQLSVDTKAVSAAWPVEKGDAPTPRAITERLLRIRADHVKKNGGQHFGISQASKSPRSKTTTPRKPKANTATQSPSPSKRKRNSESMDIVKAESIENDDDIKRPFAGPPLKPNGPRPISSSLTSSFGGVAQRSYPPEDDSPANKRARASTAKYTVSDVGDDNGSEFMDDEAV